MIAYYWMDGYTEMYRYIYTYLSRTFWCKQISETCSYPVVLSSGKHTYIHIHSYKMLGGLSMTFAIRMHVCFHLIHTEQMDAWLPANPQLEWFQQSPRCRVRVAFLVDWEGSKRGISLFISIPVGALPAEINFFLLCL